MFENYLRFWFVSYGFYIPNINLLLIIITNVIIRYAYLFGVLAESPQENISVSQPQRQTPPVQQPQIPQNMYNGQSPGTMNQHNPYSGGQIPPQGLY